ncbi:MAG: peptidoglycan DD-metalloendopeptidase family protein [Betaproteobacteria bacterium]|nr:peptidoglycan DD-metalloendopeptidase family protein [Betaproteobacteria bacterium]
MKILAQSLGEGVRRRLSWLAAGAAVLLFGVVAAFGTVQTAVEPVLTQPIVEPLAPLAQVTGAAGEIFFNEERFQRGDTFAVLLDRIGIEDGDAERLLRSAQGSRALRALRPGTTVQAKTGAEGELHSLWFVTGRDTLLSIERSGKSFDATEQQALLSRRLTMKSGTIRSSLFAATDEAGVPDGVAVQIADIFAGDVDFHRDLRRGDRFAVVYELFHHQGRALKLGRVLAAEFVNQSKTYRAVWFQDASGRGGYYTPEGRNLRKAFLRSPLEFSRITSGFGMRHHPIRREWRNHKGVDYGAPAGTRVRATGDGVVDFIGRQGGYGNLLLVRHAGTTMTAYGHLNSFARGLRRGMRVSQGEVIGYVGQTGLATGPHLHYEFRINNQQRNPLAIAFPAAQPIAQEKLAAFRAEATDLAARLDLLKTTHLALLE